MIIHVGSIDVFSLSPSLPVSLLIQLFDCRTLLQLKAVEGEKIPKEKLQQEIVAPYKQNWIGFMSVAVIILATIISQNPEIFESPTIPIPDL